MEISLELLNLVKARCGIPASVTVYDDSELQPLIMDALEDMKTAGVPAWILEDMGDETNPRVLTAIAHYVNANRGADRTDTALYMKLYRNKLNKLMLEPDEQEG